MQYEFKRFGEGADVLSPSIQLILNGENLNEKFTSSDFSFKVLSVSGRGRINHNINSVKVSGRNGLVVKGRTLDPRDIVVTAVIRASSNESYRDNVSDLLYYLHKDTINTLKFTDDMDFTYYATFDSLEDEDELKNRQEIRLNFTCHDPFKYGNYKVSNNINLSSVTVDTQFPIIPEEIKITFSSSADAKDFEIENVTTGDTIQFSSREGSSTSQVSIRIPDREVRYLPNGLNAIRGVNIRNSNFHSFTVNNNDVINITPTPTNVSMSYKGVFL